MPHLYLRLLGGFDVQVSGQSGALLSIKKAQALLAYLALYPGQHQPREKLAALLWGEMTDEFARTNLRQTLAVLRKALVHKKRPCVLNAGTALCLDDAQAEIDVVRFEQCCDQATPAALEEAITLYRGEFLEGFALDEEAFEDWLVGERRRLNERQLQALNALLIHYMDTARHERAVDIAVKLLVLDPLQEAVHRTLIHCYQAQGRLRAALRQYRSLREILQRELGAAPAADTEQLYRQLLGQPPLPAAEPQPGDCDSVRDNPPPATILPANAASAYRQRAPITMHWAAILAGVLALALIAAILSYQRPWQYQQAAQENSGPGALLRLPGLSFDKPSIAVLPFKNLSNDPEQAYFSDGLSEDLITDFSRISGLLVIARTSSFAYREQALTVRQIARQLGVRYMLEGSVRKVQNRVRINAQLIDAASGVHLWADRYDRNMTDILALQDEVTETIVSALSVSLTQGEKAQFGHTKTIDPDAYDVLLRGLGPLRRFTREDTAEARRLFERAIALDPDFARAHANLALTYGQDVVFRHTEQPELWIRRGLAAAANAEALDNSISQLHFARAVLYLAQRNHDDAIMAAYRAIQLDPNYADGYAVLAQALSYAGVLNEAMAAIRSAKRLNPLYPFTYLWIEAHILFLQGHYEEAIPVLQEVIWRNPSFDAGHLMLAAVYGQLGRREDAEWEIAEILMLKPDFSLQAEGRAAVYQRNGDLTRYIEGLRKAGLPE